MDRVDHCPVSGWYTDITNAHAATHLPGVFDDHLEPTEELLWHRVSVLRIFESSAGDSQQPWRISSIGERGGLVVNASDSLSRGRGFEPHSG